MGLPSASATAQARGASVGPLCPMACKWVLPAVTQPQETQHLFKHLLGCWRARCCPAAWLGLCQWDVTVWGGGIGPGCSGMGPSTAAP